MFTVPRKMCFMLAPASEWKEDIERIAHYTHCEGKKYAAQLVCDCSNKLAFLLFGVALAFQAWLWPFGPVFGLVMAI